MRIDQIEDIYPASPLQQDLLPQGSPTREAIDWLQFTISGALNHDDFGEAWERVINKYPILRTAFAWRIVYKPLQLVYRHAQLPLEKYDWQALSDAERKARVTALLEWDSEFYPANAPLFRLYLCRLTESDYELVVHFHRLILDRGSVRALLREVFDFYRKSRSGLESAPIDGGAYRHYILQLKPQYVSQAEMFWSDLLSGFTAPTRLPVERGNPPRLASKPEFATVALYCSPEFKTSFQSLAERNHVTSKVLLNGVWALLLSRYSAERDIVFGSSFSSATNDLADADSIVGPLRAILPVRVHIHTNDSTIEWLKRFQAQLVAISRYSFLPLARIQALSGVSSNFPLFETVLSLEDRVFEDAWPGKPWLNVREVWRTRNEAYAMTLTAGTTPALEFQLTYNSHRFEKVTAERMLGHLRTLLESMITGSEERLGALSMLTTLEKDQLLIEWNRTSAPYPYEHGFQHLFEQQALRSADAIALEKGEERLTYRELNRRANQLAHHLRGFGVGPEVLVGIFVERSIEMLVSLLGILKAGGAYAPLDTTYPMERLSMILEDARVSVLLVQGHLADRLPSRPGLVICVDEQWEEIARESEENPLSGAGPENLAYVIYTSGTTGIPKGASIRHAGLVNYLNWCVRAYQVGGGCGAPVHSPITFDLTVTSLFAPLLTGAKVVMAADAIGIDALADEVRRGGDYSFIKLTPAHLEALKQRVSSTEIWQSSRVLIIGGDALIAEDVAFWSPRASRARLINEYGPTETVVGCCAYELPAGWNRGGRVPIGQPIDNTRLFILDGELQPVPIGVVGELHIGGAGLARGYHNRPELTAEKFVPDPFGIEAGARLYKSGDLALYLSDGNIEFLGRTDNQVKIRGFRLELGEVETNISEYPAVREVAVIVREDKPSDKRLVAYLTPNHKPVPSVSDLRDFLSRKLPEYMIPSVYTWLDKMPLTAHGKIDRKALSMLKASEAQSEEPILAPRNNVERILAEILARVLGLERVGVNMNFFELGGDSILGIKVIAEAARAGLRITMSHLFQYPTISDLAMMVDDVPAAENEQYSVTGALPLTPIQCWFFEQNFPNPHHWNIAVLLEAVETLDPALLEKVTEELLRRHDALRLRFTQAEDGWRQRIDEFDGAVSFERVDLTMLTEVERGRSIEATAARAQESLNLFHGPLVRFIYFDVGIGAANHFLIVIHHLAVDGVSLRILFEDLQLGYQHISHGQKIELPSRTTSYKRWAERLLEYAQSEVLAREAEYWLSITPDETESVPTDHSFGANVEATARTVTVSLSAEETRGLLYDTHKAYRTQINDILLTALVQAYLHWSGIETLLVDLEGHGRETPFEDLDLSRTAGWFTNIFPARLDLRGARRPQDALISIKEQLRQAPDRGIGYGMLRYLKGGAISTQLRALPQAEISFNYLGQFDQILSESFSFRLAVAPPPSNRSPQQPRPYLLEIVSHVIDGKLHIDWIYSENFHRRETIESLAATYVTSLGALIAHCQSPDVGGYTLSDFPKARLSQKELEKFIAKITEKSSCS